MAFRILNLLFTAFIVFYNPELTPGKQNIVVYSGNCIRYKRTFVPPNHTKSSPLDKAFSKVIINRSTKQISFYYNGQLVFSRNSFDSEIDQQGREGLISYNGAEMVRYIAEKHIEIILNDPLSRHGQDDLGYEYDIANYSTN